MTLRYVRGHNCETFGRPDHRSKELFVYDDRNLLGVVRLTPPAHTNKWYWSRLPLVTGRRFQGPCDTKEEATAQLLGHCSAGGVSDDTGKVL